VRIAAPRRGPGNVTSATAVRHGRPHPGLASTRRLVVEAPEAPPPPLPAPRSGPLDRVGLAGYSGRSRASSARRSPLGGAAVSSAGRAFRVSLAWSGPERARGPIVPAFPSSPPRYLALRPIARVATSFDVLSAVSDSVSA
jgi:hypothetical protein